MGLWRRGETGLAAELSIHPIDRAAEDTRERGGEGGGERKGERKAKMEGRERGGSEWNKIKRGEERKRRAWCVRVCVLVCVCVCVCDRR